jgi:osmoprotectant transport system permease protein
MSLFSDAIHWLLDPAQWTGTYALPVLLGQHLLYTVLSVLIAMVIAVPSGWLIGHTGRGREVAVAISGAARAIPSFVLQVPAAALVTFVLLAIPSLLAGSYTGIEAIDPRVVDAAKAVGMTPWQVFWKVEFRLGLPLLIGGIRAATLQVIATVTIAAWVNLGGLGFPIIQGIPLNRFDQVLAGAIVVAVLALIVDLLFAIAQRAAVPVGVRASASRSTDRPRTRAVRASRG